MSGNKKGFSWMTFQLLTIFFMMLTPFVWIFAVVVFSGMINKETSQPYSCVIESVELEESSGGPRTSTSHKTIYVDTANCGIISMKRLGGMEVDSYEDLVQKLEERKGQAVVFHIGRLQVIPDDLRAERAEL